MKTVGVIVFPGSNCDDDTVYALTRSGFNSHKIWHQQSSVGNVDAVVLPGGFSYGDYLRCGAIAKVSPIMKDVIRFAQSGGKVLGICNGFQILVESGLLPGALLRNRDLHFICKTVALRLETTDTPFTSRGQAGKVYHFPIAHMDGNYYIDDSGYRDLEANNQIIFRYCDESGAVTAAANPNGAVANIAGICNRTRNVLGLMPHPERVSDAILGSAEGMVIFESLKD